MAADYNPAAYPAPNRSGDATIRYDRDDRVTALPAVLRRTAWGAIIAGALVGFGLQLILTVLGVALGLSMVDANSDPSAEGITIAAGLWWLVTGTISIFVGGAVTGRLAGINRSCDLHLHGIAMWAVVAAMGFLTVASGLGMGATAGSNAAGSLAGRMPMQGMNFAMSGPTAYGQATGDTRTNTASGMPSINAGSSGNANAGTTGRDAANTSAANRSASGTATGATGTAASRDRDTDDDDADIARNFDNRPTYIRDASGNIVAAAPSQADVERARRATRTASWWTFGGLLLGVGAAVAGAWVTAPNRSVVLPTSVPQPEHR